MIKAIPPQSPECPKSAGPASTAEGPPMRTQAEIDAHAIGEVVIPSMLACILAKSGIGTAGTKLAFIQFMRQAGDPKDPVERLLLEHLFIAHHRSAMLQFLAMSCDDVKAVQIYGAASVRLLGEIRRFALTVRNYRQPPGQKSFSVIGQQNLVQSGTQEVTYVDAAD